VKGGRQVNGKTYWNLEILRTIDDGYCGQIPDSCFYLLAFPNPFFHPTQIGIREEEGRWLVDKGEYMSLISDTCWWKYVGDASFIPYEDTGDGELVLYDFNKQAGETYGAAEGHDPIIVDAVDFIETDDGIVRRRQTLSNGLQIVEGIGCINSPGLLLFYLNPRQSMLDYAMLSSFFDGEKTVYARKFEEMAEAAAYEYEQRSVLLDCPDDNHPHAIDLGLPSGLKWACCNIGAGLPQEEGSLFAWGETEEKDRYELENYRFHTTEYHCDFSGLEGTISGTQYDVAHSRWGGQWRIATVEETEELVHCCSHEVVRNQLAYGLKLTGPNGKSILLPFTFEPVHTTTYTGIYWTGNLYPFIPMRAYALKITNNPLKYVYFNFPYLGMTVRPLAWRGFTISVDGCQPWPRVRICLF